MKMKLIMESWRRNQLNEANVSTVNEMILLVRAIMTIKKGEALTGAALSVASSLAGGAELLGKLSVEGTVALFTNALGVAETAVGLITGAADIKDVIKNFATLPDSQRSSAGYLKMLDFDDEYLKMLDNNLDNDILNDMLKRLENSADVDISNVDVNAWLEEFIRASFNRSIDGADVKKATDIKSRGKMGVAGQRLKQTKDRVMGDIS